MSTTETTETKPTTTVAEDALALAKRIQTELSPTWDRFRLVQMLEALAHEEMGRGG